jgi:hypothetical protein|tara:strand:- start:459 stop:590 length:132 start_codon:yes stop_codon:yes gene_type:complete
MKTEEIIEKMATSCKVLNDVLRNPKNMMNERKNIANWKIWKNV